MHNKKLAATVFIAGTIALGSAQAATNSFSYSGAPVPIPDGADLSGTAPGAQVGAPITVAGISYPVSKVTMSIDGTVCTATAGATTVGLDHTFANDLVLTLRSPNGTDIVVVQNTDGSGNNFCQVVLDDAASTSIQSVATAQAPFTGTWLPNAPLAGFNGETANGDWTLLAQDFFAFDTGNIRAWTITITDDAAPTAAPVTVSGTAMVGQTLTGGYTYGDNESDPEDTTASGTGYRFVRSTDNDVATTGDNTDAATGSTDGTNATYTLQAADQASYLFYCVTPVATTGTTTGTETCSAANGPVSANTAPTADPVTLSGTAIVGLTLTGSYTYGDDENDPEDTTASGSTYRFVRSTDNSVATTGDNTDAATGSTSGANATYTLQAADQAGYLFYCVTPVATTGTTTGTETCSAARGPISANAAPTAAPVTLSGTAMIGQTLTGGYTYGDSEGDPEDTTASGTTYRFIRSSDSNVATTGDNTDAATGSTGGANATYTLQAADQRSHLFYCVTPVATTGTATGTETCSAASAPVSAAMAEAVPVPTLSGWATMLLVVLLPLLGWRRDSWTARR